MAGASHSQKWEEGLTLSNKQIVVCLRDAVTMAEWSRGHRPWRGIQLRGMKKHGGAGRRRVLALLVLHTTYHSPCMYLLLCTTEENGGAGGGRRKRGNKSEMWCCYCAALVAQLTPRTLVCGVSLSPLFPPSPTTTSIPTLPVVRVDYGGRGKKKKKRVVCRSSARGTPT